jgi:DNA-binding transcriptional LysR family regulator
MIDGARPPCDRAHVVDWNDLRYLLAIAKAGTLAGAARELGVEHTTVGRRLNALEAALATRLFTRGPEGFAPTGAARAILPIAEEIAARVESIERRVAGEDARVEGTVRVTTSEALSGYLVKQLGVLRQRYPELVVEILAGNRAYDLPRGEADVAIRVREVTEPDLVARKVAIAGWSLYASRGYVGARGVPPSPEDLRGHDVVAFDQTMSATPGAQWLQAHGAGTNVAVRGNSIVASLNAVLLGMGVSVLPCFLGDAERSLQRLTPRVLGARDVWLVVHPDLARVARVRVVMDYVVEIFVRDAVMWAGTVAAAACSGAPVKT